MATKTPWKTGFDSTHAQFNILPDLILIKEGESAAGQMVEAALHHPHIKCQC